MFRTITSLLICLVIAIIIGAFQILGLSLTDIQAIMEDPAITDTLKYLGGLLFAALIFPYHFATAHAIYAPIVALGVAGFVSGLISKSGVRMFFVSLIALVLFFVGYMTLSLSMAWDASTWAALAQSIAVDLGAAFGLLFVPGIIGASLTAEEY